MKSKGDCCLRCKNHGENKEYYFQQLSLRRIDANCAYAKMKRINLSL